MCSAGVLMEVTCLVLFLGYGLMEGAMISSYHPSNGPSTGGTEVTITGEEFLTTGNTRSKCNFQREDGRGVVFSQINLNYNSTHISCVFPAASFFTSPLPPQGVNVRLSVTAGPGQFSNYVPFLVYDLSSIIITAVSPNQALTNSSNGTRVDITGQGFIDTGEITCALDVQNATVVSAVFVNSTNLECVLPLVPLASRIRLVVSLNSQPVGAILSLADIFTFYSPPPLVVSSHFSSSYVEIFILFDREIEIGSEDTNTSMVMMAPQLDDATAALGLNCSQVLDSAALLLLGPEAVCSWLNSQQRTIVLRLSSESAVGERTHLGLNEHSLRTRGVLYSRLVGGGVVVNSLPGAQLVPVAVLEGPSVVPMCGELVVSGDKSLYGGARELQYEWKVGIEVGGDGGVVPDPVFQDIVPLGFSGRSVLTIPSMVFYSASFVPGSGSGGGVVSMYILQLVVRNYFGYVSSAVLHNLTTTIVPSPSVVIVGGGVQRVQGWREILLEGKLLRPTNECSVEFRVIGYTWSLGGEVADRQVLQRNLSVLILPPNTLLPGLDYTATLTVLFNTGVSSSASVHLESVEGLEAWLAGGVRRAVGVDESIELDGRLSLISHHSSTRLHVAWGCSPAAISQLGKTNASCQGFTSPDSIYHSMPAGSLPSGGYNFTLALSLVGEGGLITLQSSATQVLVVFPNPVPRVRIASAHTSPVLIHRKFALGAEVSNPSPDSRAQWSVEYVEGYGLLQLRSNVSRAPLQYPVCSSPLPCPHSETSVSLYSRGSTTDSIVLTNQLALVLTELLLLPRNSYRFKLSVTDAMGQVGFAEMDVQTESIPTSGQLEITPREGRSLSTIFTLRTFGWTDERGDNPYRYQFGIRYLCSSQGGAVCVEWLTGITADNCLSTVLPDIAPALAPEILLHVFDSYGALRESTLAFGDIILFPRSPGENTEVTHLMSLMADVQVLAASGYWVQGLAHLASLLSSIDVDHTAVICNESLTQLSPTLQLSNSDIISLKTEGLQVLLEMFYTFTPCSETHHQLILSLLQKTTRTHCRNHVVQESHWSESGVLGTLGLIQGIVSKAAEFSDAIVLSRRGFSVQDVKIVLSIFEQILFIPAATPPLYRVGNNITAKLSQLLPDISYSLCTRQDINEESSLVGVDGFANIKSSHINLPFDYVTSGCLDNSCIFEPVRINFGARLLSRYLQWDCGDNGSCSGVCLTSGLFHVDILWQGSEFSSLLKTPPLYLSLQNPTDGTPLEVQLPITAGPLLTFPIVAPYSRAPNLACVIWDAASLLWEDNRCTIDVVTEQSRAMCRCSNVGSLFYAVLERCPSGYYGQTCNQTCPQGLWGSECRESCDCSNRGTCSAVDGSCNCDPGWMGMRCADACPEGSYGQLCGEACLCQNAAACHHVTGDCGCTDGWIGLLCNTSCTQGFYGDGCAMSCECRNVSECHHVTGACTCQAGYSGSTCHDFCPSGTYGLGCASNCQCFNNGTRSCDPVDGSCDCHDMWRGTLCNIQVTPPPMPAPVPSSFQIWWAVVGVVGAIVAAACIAVVLILLFIWRKRKRKKVLPVSIDGQETGTDGGDSSDMSDEFVISRTKSLEVLVPAGKSLKDVFVGTSPVSDTGATLEFKEPPVMNGKYRWQIVRVLSDGGSEGRKTNSSLMESVESSRPTSRQPHRVTPQAEVEGRRGKAVTSSPGTEGKGSGEEGPKDGVVVAQVKDGGRESDGSPSKPAGGEGKGEDEAVPQSREEGATANEVEKERAVSSQDRSETENSDKGKDTPTQQEQTELVYRKGVYLPADATLKDLRNRFVESEQLDQKEGLHFQFLLSDVPGDRIELDTEDEVILRQIEDSLVQRRTLYIESIDPSHALGELCVCGRFADLECTSCRKRGYCSKSCQEKDWPTHELFCRKVSSRRQRRHRRRKSRNEERRSSSGSNPPMSEDTCVCGKEAQYECSGCRKQGYCSEACQNEDWSFHDYYCKQPGSTSTGGGGVGRLHSQTPLSMHRGKLQTVFEDPEET